MKYDELVKALRYCSSIAVCRVCPREDKGECFDSLHRDAADAIEALQHELNVQKNMLENLLLSATETLIPKRGKWIGRQNHKKCSVCGRQAIYDVALQSDMKTPYCPNCGAKMEVQD